MRFWQAFLLASMVVGFWNTDQTFARHPDASWWMETGTRFVQFAVYWLLWKGGEMFFSSWEQANA